MPELKIAENLKKIVDKFVEELQEIYADQLVSVTLYGSALSGEFSQTHSNINLLLVLKTADLPTLEKSRKLVRQFFPRRIEPLFVSQQMIASSLDVFPIEFLDMQDNHQCLYGLDVLRDIKIDLKNLRFQCEQELRSKAILIKQQYLKINPKDRSALATFLFKNFTSVVHILRNALRLKGREPSYRKDDVLKEISDVFSAGNIVFLKVWEAKKNSSKVRAQDLAALLTDFVVELDNIIEKVDKL
jgi:hypothetical protein